MIYINLIYHLGIIALLTYRAVDPKPDGMIVHSKDLLCSILSQLVPELAIQLESTCSPTYTEKQAQSRLCSWAMGCFILQQS